jgi:D-alanyl-D-alanine carboxypeptidase
MSLLAAAVLMLAPQPFHSSIKPLPPPVKAELTGRYWHANCPVPLTGLRLLTVTHWGFDKHRHTGQLVVNRSQAAPLARVFHRLYKLHFPIRHLSFAAMYGPSPADGDISGSFECRQAVPSPCSGGSGTGNWSNHAYGNAVDLNPVENPYVGCGQTRDKTAVSYMDRSRVRPGMVTPAVIAAFASIGWGWGGSWSGNTKDYMHFSTTGH